MDSGTEDNQTSLDNLDASIDEEPSADENTRRRLTKKRKRARDSSPPYRLHHDRNKQGDKGKYSSSCSSYTYKSDSGQSHSRDEDVSKLDFLILKCYPENCPSPNDIIRMFGVKQMSPEMTMVCHPTHAIPIQVGTFQSEQRLKGDKDLLLDEVEKNMLFKSAKSFIKEVLGTMRWRWQQGIWITDVCKIPDVFVGEIKLLSFNGDELKWEDALGDSSTEKYKEVTDELESALTELYDNIEGFIKAEVTGYNQGIVAEFEIHFSSDKDVRIGAVETPLKEKTQPFDHIGVDPTSVLVVSPAAREDEALAIRGGFADNLPNGRSKKAVEDILKLCIRIVNSLDRHVLGIKDNSIVLNARATGHGQTDKSSVCYHTDDYHIDNCRPSNEECKESLKASHDKIKNKNKVQMKSRTGDVLLTYSKREEFGNEDFLMFVENKSYPSSSKSTNSAEQAWVHSLAGFRTMSDETYGLLFEVKQVRLFTLSRRNTGLGYWRLDTKIHSWELTDSEGPGSNIDEFSFNVAQFQDLMKTIVYIIAKFRQNYPQNTKLDSL